jgi:hypothetical protein
MSFSITYESLVSIVLCTVKDFFNVCVLPDNWVFENTPCWFVTFLAEQTSHQQSANSTFLSEQISTGHQPPAERTHHRVRRVAPRTHWAYVSIWVPLPPIHSLTQHTTLFFFFSTLKALARKPVVATLFALRFGLSPYFCHRSLMQMAVKS